MSRKKHVTPTRIRLATAAKILGCSRASVYRRLRQYAVYSDGPKSPLEIDSSRVFKLLANDRLGELPIVPELQNIHDMLEAQNEVLERLARGVAALAQKVGTRV